MVNQSTIEDRVRRSEIDNYCVALPATIVAQFAGGLYLLWVLWPVMSHKFLLISASLLAVVLASALGLYLYQRHAPSENTSLAKYLILYSFANGCYWGAAALYLYPMNNVAYTPFILVLLSILPFVPVAAMAGYLPAFLAYLVPVSAPFLYALVSTGGRGGWSAAVLLAMLLVAATRFAIQYHQHLVDAVRLRLEVEEQKIILERANLDKAKFMASASHDLRQPVHSLSLLIDALDSHAVTDEVRQLHGHISSAGEAMYGLLDAMLDISKLDAGVVDVDVRPFPVGGLLQRLAADSMPQAAEKRLRLSVVPTSLVIASDQVLLEQLLRNLLMNAIQFTHNGGIVLGCRRRGEQCLIQVVDTGAGIDGTDLERIFDEFIQLENPERDRRKGLGLGLANAKRIASLLQHDLAVHSKQGKGSIFSVRVPLRETAEVQCVPEEVIVAVDSIANTALLVIDDEADIRQAMNELAKIWLCEVIAVASAKEAKAVLSDRAITPDMMIVDYRLRDDATGIEAIALVNQFLGKKIPALVVTGDTGKAVLQEVRGAGHTIVHKPVRPGQIRAMIAQAIRTPDLEN